MSNIFFQNNKKKTLQTIDDRLNRQILENKKIMPENNWRKELIIQKRQGKNVIYFKRTFNRSDR